MSTQISEAEYLYIQSGCDVGIRSDGRDKCDFRSVAVEADLFPHLHGSSRVTVQGGTEVICSIKLEIAQPTQQSPNEGILGVSIEISPASNLKLDDKKIQELEVNIALRLQSIYLESKALNLSSLSIINGKYCWNVNIDLLVVQAGGNILDICSWAAYVALCSTRIPKIETIEGERGELEDFELASGDLVESLPMNGIDIPLLITISKVGDALIVDCSPEEETCVSYSLVIAVDRLGRCCGIQKMLGGILLPSEVNHAIPMAILAAKDIFVKLDHVLRVCSEEDRKYPDTPPVRIGLLA